MFDIFIYIKIVLVLVFYNPHERGEVGQVLVTGQLTVAELQHSDYNISINQSILSRQLVLGNHEKVQWTYKIVQIIKKYF